MSKKDNLVYKAKLAEQAERYDGLYTICCLFFIFADTRNVIGHVIISVLFTAPRVHLEFFGSGSYNWTVSSERYLS